MYSLGVNVLKIDIEAHNKQLIFANTIFINECLKTDDDTRCIMVQVMFHPYPPPPPNNLPPHRFALQSQFNNFFDTRIVYIKS